MLHSSLLEGLQPFMDIILRGNDKYYEGYKAAQEYEKG